MKKILFLLLLALCAGAGIARNTFTIGSDWRFHKGDAANAEQADFSAKGWSRVNIPHTWNVEDTEDDAYGYYRGIGWYRKTLRIDTIGDERVFLRFEAANLVADVWVNGQLAGERHYGGYTPFVFDITDKIKKGDNIIAVKVDNSKNSDVPPLDADFTFFGGIYRDVSIIKTAPTHFDMKEGNGVFVSTPEVSAAKAKVLVNVVIDGKADKKLSVRHTILNAQGAVVATKTVGVQKAGKAMAFEVVKPTLWDVDNPYLYTVVSEIVDAKGNVVDKVKNPLGIRTFHFDANKGFFLNGRPLKLMGANRHQDFPGRGNALPDEIHRYDMALMKDAGVNCLRISHYPHDEALLEMCDKYGFVCFEECPIINAVTMTDEFDKHSRSQIREMIKRDYNHPCIVSWNTSNEITQRYQLLIKDPQKKEEYGVKLSKFLAGLNDYVHELDPSRPSMIVMCFEPELNHEKGFHQADIIAYNKYFGWYEGSLDDMATFMQRLHKTEPDKPIFMTEFGSGSDVRIHSFKPQLYDHSEEYQCNWFKKALAMIQNTEYMSGGTIWHFEEFHSENRGEAIPHVNEKSLVTRDRRRKASFYYFKTLMSKKPFISIPSQCWTTRGGLEDNAGVGVCTQPVEVFANTPTVELKLNGKSLGVKNVDELSAVFDVPFVDGTNYLALSSPDNDSVFDFLKVNFTIQPKQFANARFKEIAVNCGSLCYVNDSKMNDYLWYPDTVYMAGSYGHTGGHTFTRGDRKINSTMAYIAGTELTPLYQTQQIGMDGYQFDVANGTYEVTLCFAELYPKADREFDVLINGDKVLSNFNLNKQFGANRAVSSRYTIDVQNGKGINISFKAIKDEPVINGIKIRKVF